MRIRLTVERHRLPTTSILWTVPDTTSPQAYTIARLLEDVNHILPLEAEHWGLEDYAVEVGGFECLHFSPVAQTLKEDDHVSIRPLLTAEVRSRTLTGRYQISDGGQHLIDGVPFGRPYLRQPTRPTVRIPPRKRRRLLDDFETGEQLEVARLITSHGEQAAMNASTSTTLDTSRVSSQGGLAQSRGKPKAVHFRLSQVDQNNSSDESDEDFLPEDDSDQEDHSDENEDMSESDSHPVSESESESESSPGPSSDSDADSNSGGSSSPSDASTSSSDSDIASPKSRTDSPPDVITSRPNVEDPKHTSPILNSHVPPGQGSKQTQSRNARRTQSKRLQKLKEIGELHPDATLQDLRVYEATNSPVPQTSDAELPITPFAKFSGKRKRLIEGDEVITCANDEDPEELDRRKRELMAKVAAGGPHIGEPQNTNPEASVHETSKRQSSKVENVNGTIKSSQMPQSEEPTKPPSKRLRPDTSAISRILSRQARPTNARVAKANHQQEDDKPPEIEGISDPDFWKSRVNLSAFECWNENYELSAPPFPFKQHWDPASKQMRDNTTKKKRKKNGAKEPLHTPNATDDAANGILNYDDAPVKEQQAEYDTVAEVDMQLLRNLQTVDHIDLPLLPDDVSALPDLGPADIKEDAVIAFRLWLIDPATVTPEISAYKTAIVEKEGDSGNGAGTIRLRLADRDVPKREKKFDKNGNRVYDAVDGFFMEEEERDDSLWEGTFNELQEAKLLRAAE